MLTPGPMCTLGGFELPSFSPTRSPLARLEPIDVSPYVSTTNPDERDAVVTGR
jgi:hypothetical protein